MDEKEALIKDPAPWRNADGVRVADPWANASPSGGYTFDPREGYSDYEERWISNRSYK
ncbi:hypothetical protein [Rathayibacter sp. VKM Ac-2630]|uniref:hypothetical protein n=1 Tax=Rathayibacter sp. VKM Ac-2630 TaxID=1938617 RepID=UPI0013015404|nr:hypothetical protein [Rathayibacter sp. VKM Ac-2630]